MHHQMSFDLPVSLLTVISSQDYHDAISEDIDLHLSTKLKFLSKRFIKTTVRSTEVN